VVLKGSSGRSETTASFKKYGYAVLRSRLLEQGVLVEQDGRLVFAQDHLFSSPSAAAACVMGRTANGLVEWKDGEGRVLGQLQTGSSTD